MSTGVVEELTINISAMDLEPASELKLTYDEYLHDINNLTNYFFLLYVGTSTCKVEYQSICDFVDNIQPHYFADNDFSYFRHPEWSVVRNYIVMDSLNLPKWFCDRYFDEYIDIDAGNEADMEFCLSCGNESVVDGSCWYCINEESSDSDDNVNIPSIPN